MSLATINGRRLTHARVQIPAYGCWYAEVATDEDGDALSGAVTIEIADLTLQGTILSGGPSKGRGHYRVVAGAGGWGRTIPAKGYTNDLGVKLATVLSDAASAAGETLGTLPSTKLDYAFARPEGPASDVLALLAPEAWYVDEAGVTQLGRRAARTLETTAPRTAPLDPARGTLTLASESLVDLLPGVTVDGLEAADVHHELGEMLRTTLYGTTSTNTSRRLGALRRMIELMFPALPFLGLTEYRVVTQEGERLNLQPVRVSARKPDLRRVYVRPGVAGCRADVALGARVLVAFIDGNPARPVVVAFEDAEGGGFLSDELTIDANDAIAIGSGGPAAARVGDTVGRFIFDATATTLFYSPSAIAPYVPVASVNPNSPFPPDPVQVGTPVAIATGSSKVTVE